MMQNNNIVSRLPLNTIREREAAREQAVYNIIRKIGDGDLRHYITVTLKADDEEQGMDAIGYYAQEHPSLLFVDMIPDIDPWFTGMFWKRGK